MLVEVNVGMNRAGVKRGEPVVEFTRTISRCQGIRFAGVMGWEGHAITVPDTDEKRRLVESRSAC
jgi:D-serine deaminase-like pyridoxal phosphate-dependent protein